MIISLLLIIIGILFCFFWLGAVIGIPLIVFGTICFTITLFTRIVNGTADLLWPRR